MKLLSPKDHKQAMASRREEMMKEGAVYSAALSQSLQAINDVKRQRAEAEAELQAIYDSEMAVLNTKRNALAAEVQGLEERKRVAQEPLHREREELNRKNCELFKLQQSLDRRVEELEQAESKLEEAKRDTESSKTLYEAKEKHLESLVLQAKEKEKKAKKLLETSEKQYEKVQETLKVEWLLLGEAQGKFEAEKTLILTQKRANTEYAETLQKKEQKIASDRAAVDAVIQEAKKKGLWVA